MKISYLRPVLRWQSVLFTTLVLGCSGCEKGKDPAQPKSEASESARVGATGAPDGLPVPPGEEVSFDAALARVEQVRGLKKKDTVRGLLVKTHDLAQHVRLALAYERPEQVLQGTEQMLVGLGLVPPSFDFHATMLSLLEENLAGLYEPRLGLMMVRHDLAADTRQITLLHELVHALQDQYFDLDEIVVSRPDDSDRSSALSCLAEGDATSAMLDGVLPEGKTALDLPEGSIEAQFFAQAPQTKAPGLIIRSLYAPYLDGLKFVHQLRRRGGFEEVNRVFAEPPISTEQVLHLDKYDSREAPIAVDVPSAPDPSFKLVLHDIWGEQSLRLALEEWMEPELASQAAAGWGGDRIVSYQRANELAVAWDIVMDDEKQADELSAALSEVFGAQTKPEPDPRALAQPAPLCTSWGESGPAVAFARQGRHVLLVGGPYDRAQRAGDCGRTVGWLETLLGKLDP